jgi:hypothetical protein
VSAINISKKFRLDLDHSFAHQITDEIFEFGSRDERVVFSLIVLFDEFDQLFEVFGIANVNVFSRMLRRS